MKRASSLVAILVCFAAGASSAFAATEMTVASKLQRFANPELCFLEGAATENDTVLVRDELNRRNVQCTSELRTEGKAALEQNVRVAQLQAAKSWKSRAIANRDMRERQETDRLIRCASVGGQAAPGCRNGY
ncbi:MAG: hypothetical protein ABI905_03510 [Betaproteobacteria bacterium]